MRGEASRSRIRKRGRGRGRTTQRSVTGVGWTYPEEGQKRVDPNDEVVHAVEFLPFDLESCPHVSLIGLGT